jgi:CRP-like cAMP-binding protein
MLELTDDLEKNQILAALSEVERASLLPHVKKVRLNAREMLVQPETGERYIWFPTKGIGSTMVIMGDGTGVEIMLTGSEGCLELETAMGDCVPSTQTAIHIAGSAVRVPASIIARAFFTNNHFSRVLQSYVQQRFMQVTQVAACNRLHSAEQRLARWLLTMEDRVRSNVFPVTHEILGQVLGTKRSTMSEIANGLKRDRMISYTHGLLRIRDRKLLEHMVCECYFRIRGFSA